MHSRSFDFRATVDAVNLISGIRIKNSCDIPLSIWKMMCSAEARLNAEIEVYLRDQPPGERTVDTVDGTPSLMHLLA